MADTNEAQRLARVWRAVNNKLASYTAGSREATELYVKLGLVWEKAVRKGDLGLMRRVISWGDELKAPFEAAEKGRIEAERRKREAGAARLETQRRRAAEKSSLVKSANQEAVNRAFETALTSRAPVGVKTQGLEEAERLYREREHIVAHGKKKARPSKKGKSKGG